MFFKNIILFFFIFNINFYLFGSTSSSNFISVVAYSNNAFNSIANIGMNIIQTFPNTLIKNSIPNTLIKNSISNTLIKNSILKYNKNENSKKLLNEIEKKFKYYAKSLINDVFIKSSLINQEILKKNKEKRFPEIEALIEAKTELQEEKNIELKEFYKIENLEKYPFRDYTLFVKMVDEKINLVEKYNQSFERFFPSRYPCDIYHDLRETVHLMKDSLLERSFCQNKLKKKDKELEDKIKKLEQAKEELEKTKTESKEKKEAFQNKTQELEKANEEKLKKIEEELEKTKTESKEKEEALNQGIEELKKNKAEYEKNKEELEKTKTESKEKEEALKKIEEELQNKIKELEQAKEELEKTKVESKEKEESKNNLFELVNENKKKISEADEKISKISFKNKIPFFQSDEYSNSVNEKKKFEVQYENAQNNLLNFFSEQCRRQSNSALSNHSISDLNEAIKNASYWERTKSIFCSNTEYNENKKEFEIRLNKLNEDLLKIYQAIPENFQTGYIIPKNMSPLKQFYELVKNQSTITKIVGTTGIIGIPLIYFFIKFKFSSISELISFILNYFPEEYKQYVLPLLGLGFVGNKAMNLVINNPCLICSANVNRNVTYCANCLENRQNEVDELENIMGKMNFKTRKYNGHNEVQG